MRFASLAWFVWMLAVGSGGARVHAQSTPTSAPAHGPALNWTRQPGAEACIGSVELATRIEARVNHRLFVPAPDAILAIEGHVQPDGPNGFVARIAVSDGRGTLFGTRELRSAGSCRELDDALALVISVTLRPEDGALGGIELPESVAQALDALFHDEPSEADPAAFPLDEDAQRAAAEAPAPAAVAQTAPAATRRAQDVPAAWWLELGALDHLGLEPSLTFGGSAGVRFEAAAIGSLAVRAALSLPTVRDVVDGAQRSTVRFSHAQAALEYCAPRFIGSAALGVTPCAMLELGVLGARGEDFAGGATARSELWSAGALTARAHLQLAEHWRLALALGPELHLVRPQFVYVAQSGARADLHRVPLVGAVAELSLAFRLP